MKRIIGVALIALVGVSYSFTRNTVAEEPEVGIEFQHITFKEALTQAKKTKKLIFVDCYTGWCGPCKRMAATSFKDQKVGDVYNKQFINIKVEMEKDAEGPEMARMYRVQAYPTLLVIDGDGKVVKQVVGGQSTDGLLNLAVSVAKKK